MEALGLEEPPLSLPKNDLPATNYPRLTLAMSFLAVFFFGIPWILYLMCYAPAIRLFLKRPHAGGTGARSYPRGEREEGRTDRRRL